MTQAASGMRLPNQSRRKAAVKARATKDAKRTRGKKPILEEVRAKNSRKSSAYHCAQAAAKARGCSDEEAKRLASEVAGRTYAQLGPNVPQNSG